MKKIALLSNVTVGMIATKLKKKIHVCISNGYNTLVNDIYNQTSCLYTGRYDAVFLLIDGYESKNWDSIRADEYYEEWISAIDVLASRVTDVPIFVSTISIEAQRICSYSEKTYWRDWENKWYNKIFDVTTKNNNIYIWDLARVIYDVGSNNYYSSKMWYMGGAPFSKLGIDTVCQEIQYAMDAMFEKRSKGIALDLDNTLWGGVIGEDGITGIELSNHKEGERFYDFQYQLLEMKKRGVLLAVLSKNNVEDVEPVWKNADMLIKQEDLVFAYINWDEKAANLRLMQEELNLTDGSFVFVDDNSVEREKMLDAMIAEVPEFPVDTSMLREYAINLYNTYFRQLRTTDEDSMKTDMYQKDAKRKEMRKRIGSYEQYLQRLELTADIHLIKEGEYDRVVQLLNKTNQFNLTTIRYSKKQIVNMNHDDTIDIFTVYSADRFGDNGLVGVLICRKEEDSVIIDSFLMSCRVMGRKLEHVILSEITMYYKGKAKKLVASYIKTAKNIPVENLYEELGFKLTAIENGKKLYEYILSDGMVGVSAYSNVKFKGR